MSSPKRIKSGINVAHYESAETQNKFEQVRHSLSENAGDTTNKSLAQLIAELITFQDTALGKEVPVIPSSNSPNNEAVKVA